MRLLVIEDEAPMRTALVETLAAEGYRVQSAADGIAGLETACTGEFDLILLDVMMPGLDGFAVCKALRQRGRDMPVLMLTAKGQVDDRVEGLDSGADDYLMKPFSLKELLARVRALLRRFERGARCRTCLKSAGRAWISGGVSCVGAEWNFLYPTRKRECSGSSRQTPVKPSAARNSSMSSGAIMRIPARGRSTISSQHSEPSWSQIPANPRHLLTVRGVGYRLDL